MTNPAQDPTDQPNPAIRRPGLWRRFLPLVIWMVLIFLGSTAIMSPEHTGKVFHNLLDFFSFHPDPDKAGQWHKAIRKAGHVAEYAVLALLAARVFLGSSRPDWRRRWWILSLLVVVAFAATDEFHQTFVSGRTGQISDVAIDTAGGAAALTLCALGRSIRTRLSDRAKTDRPI